MLSTLRNFFHLLRIGFVLARHGALFPLEAMGITPLVTIPCRLVARRSSSARPGERLARALEALGPTFIKLGQMLSTRADIVGEDIADDLASLRDRLPPFDSRMARAIVERELRLPITELFQSFDETPVAAASIAQVHFAVLPDGTPVAVKILRPGIALSFARDLQLFFWLAGLIEQNVPAAHRLRPREVVEVFQNMARFELDLRLEAAAAAELRENLSSEPQVHIPAVYWNHTAHSVLTLERISGTPISDITSLSAQGHDLTELMEAMAEAFFNQVFRDGFFHADLHPGNIFVEASGAIAMVDFGIMGRIGWRDRLYVAEILRGFLNENYRHVAQVHIDAGYVPRGTSVEQFAHACRAIGKPVLDKPLNEISVGMLLGQLFKVTETFEMETQPQLLLLQKTMVMVEGVGRMLDPKVNMWKMAQPLIEQWGRDNLGGPARVKAVAQELRTEWMQLPHLYEEAKSLLHRVHRDGVQLSPTSLNQLYQQRRRLQLPWIVLGWAALIAFVLVSLPQG